MIEKWTLIGLADDEGVKNVGGRIGAAEGPAAFAEFYRKQKPKTDINHLLNDQVDFVPRGKDLSAKHNSAIEKIRKEHSESAFTVIVGGGHDYIYCHLKGIREAHPDKSIGCINIDPHFDMREPKPDFTSGSPFYVALEEGVIKGENLVEFGIHEHCNAPGLWDFAERHKVNTVTFRSLRGKNIPEEFSAALVKLASTCDLIVISFDLDSVSAPFAPGVSAPAVEGFTPGEALEMLERSGKSKKVCSLGIYELNPTYDRDNITARLAAASCHYFSLPRLSTMGLLK